MEEITTTKNIVITGGTRGIGFCMAREFLLRRCNVTISGTGEETIAQAVEKLQAHSERLQTATCDVRDYASVEALWNSAMERWGSIDIWINNAGISQPFARVWDLDERAIRAVIETNVTGMMYGSQIAMRGMMLQGRGAIYNMEGWGSDGGHMNNLNVYGTSKHALRYFT
jgi:NAD(P)-dependent dehydrogenase (short-subunit alcohol dehydrogenase family)